MPAAPKGTAHRTLEWTGHNVGAGSHRIEKWTRQAGFSSFVQWCGVFLGSALKAQGIEPPEGYASAVNWSNYGTKVASIAQARPGDIIVYGTHHVAMYLGGGRQRQGNDIDGTVGDSGVGSSLGLGPITAIRRPPYKGGAGSNIPTPAEKRKHERIASEEGGKLGSGLPFEKTFEEHVGQPGNEAIEAGANAVKSGVDLSKAVVDALEHPESLLLNIGLLGGGAFLIYYGVALVAGVHKPVTTPMVVAAKGAEL